MVNKNPFSQKISILVRHDAVKKSFQPIYDVPFEVISKSQKFFGINIKGKEKQVSLDRLKQMFSINELFVHQEPTVRFFS